MGSTSLPKRRVLTKSKSSASKLTRDERKRDSTDLSKEAVLTKSKGSASKLTGDEKKAGSTSLSKKALATKSKSLALKPPATTSKTSAKHEGKRKVAKVNLTNNVEQVDMEQSLKVRENAATNPTRDNAKSNSMNIDR